MRRGSALLMALWTILVLGVIVMSFAFEAKLQGGINLYVEGKTRVKRLLESGRTLAEVVLVNYADCKDPDLSTGTADWEDILEDDRWCVEKYELKTNGKCTIGPILLDEEHDDAGTVTIDIATVDSSGAGRGAINVNCLYKDVDTNFEDRWRIILDMIGVPRDEVKDPDDGKSISLQDYIIACWQDYRDEDNDTYSVSQTDASKGYNPEKSNEYSETGRDGAYNDYYEDHKKDMADGETNLGPANREITDLKELSRVLCFLKFPAVLTGGPLYNEEDDASSRHRRKKKKDKDAIEIRSGGLLGLGILGVSGSEKVDVNNCTAEALMTVPGIFDVDEIDEDDKSESRSLAEAIVACRKIMPEDDDGIDESRSEWPYKDMSDLKKRVEDEFSDVDMENISEAEKYLVFKPEKETVFAITITARLMDMEYVAEGEGYVADKSVRYTRWKEN